MTLEEAEDQLNRIASAFSRLTGMNIRNIDPGYREEVRDPESSLRVFMRNHPDLKMLARQEEMIRIGKSITRGTRLPQAGAFAEFHYGIPGLNFIGDQWNVYFQGGIDVKLTVFDWGKARRENRIHDYRLEKIETRRKDLIRSTGIRLGELYSTLESLAKRSAIYRDMVQIAEEESEMKRMMFDEKQISNRDFVDSLLNVEKIRSLQEKTDLESELIKVEINTLAGKKEEK